MPLVPEGAKGKTPMQGIADVWNFLQVCDFVPYLVNLISTSSLAFSFIPFSLLGRRFTVGGIFVFISMLLCCSMGPAFLLLCLPTYETPAMPWAFSGMAEWS